MSMVMSFCAVLFPRGVLDEILSLIESVSEDFPSYSYYSYKYNLNRSFDRPAVTIMNYRLLKSNDLNLKVSCQTQTLFT